MNVSHSLPLSFQPFNAGLDALHRPIIFTHFVGLGAPFDLESIEGH
jgi:hypothetical protein